MRVRVFSEGGMTFNLKSFVLALPAQGFSTRMPPVGFVGQIFTVRGRPMHCGASGFLGSVT